MSFSSHTNNRADNIDVLSKDFIQGINGIAIYAEQYMQKKYTKLILLSKVKRLF